MNISPTCVGRDPPLPIFLTPLYQPYPTPRRKRPAKELGAIRVRDLQEEAKELSEEEADVQEKYDDLKTHGFKYIIPLGKTLTLHEEQIDQASDDDATEPREHPEGSVDAENNVNAPANATEDQEGEEQDLDAEIEDMEGQNEFDEEEEEEDGDGNAELSLDDTDAMSE